MSEQTMLTRDELVQQVLSLPVDDRAFVADVLEGSLPEEALADDEITAAWTREIERRVQAYDRGETTAVDFDAAMHEVRRALEARRAARALH